MIQDRFDRDVGIGCLILRPNRALSWGASKIFLAAAAAVFLIISSVFASAGMWAVVPFAGLELGLLAVAMYLIALRQCRQQVLTFTDSEVVVEEGRDRPVRTERLPRSWARLEVRPGLGYGHPRRLFLRFRDRVVELGGFLDEIERGQVVAAWRRADSHWRSAPACLVDTHPETAPFNAGR